MAICRWHYSNIDMLEPKGSGCGAAGEARQGHLGPCRVFYEIDDIPWANIANSRAGLCSMIAAGSVKAGMPIWGRNLSSRVGLITCKVSRAYLPRDEA